MENLIWIINLAVSFFMPQANFKVDVGNIEPGKGNIVVEIYDNKAAFLKKPLLSKTQKAANKTMAFYFDIRPGAYAIAVYQDLNSNGELDKGMFHIPKEPYGFSNNYRPSFSAPVFDDCVIKITGNSTCIINLK